MSHDLHAANRQQCPLPTHRHLVYRLPNGIFTRSVYQCQIQCQLIAYKCFYYMNTFVLSHRSNEIQSLVLNVLTNVDGVYLAMKKQVTHSKTTKSTHCFFILYIVDKTYWCVDVSCVSFSFSANGYTCAASTKPLCIQSLWSAFKLATHGYLIQLNCKWLGCGMCQNISHFKFISCKLYNAK